MLDSGAYSARYSGAAIDLDEYIEFLQAHQERFKGGVINLDVIDDGRSSYQNWRRIRRAGIDAIPVYHLGTEEEWLAKYLEEADYVALGAIVKLSSSLRIRGLDRIWDQYLIDSKGVPTHKVHGLGLTSNEIVSRYPWYSVDSATCIKHASYGGILMPRLTVEGNNVEPDFRHLDLLAVSDQRAHYVGKASAFYSLPLMVKERIQRFCSDLGFQISDSIEGRTLRPRRSRKGEVRDREFDLGLYLPESADQTDNGEEQQTLSTSYVQRIAFNAEIWNRLLRYLELQGRPLKMYHVTGETAQAKMLVAQANKGDILPRLLLSYHNLKTRKKLRELALGGWNED